MLGELIEVFKLIIEIYKGNVPLTQVYTVVTVIAGVALIDIIIEIIKNSKSKNILKIIIESITFSFIGFTLYLSIYIFILRIVGFFTEDIDTLSNQDIVWIAIISYISFFVLFTFFFLYKKTSNIAIKGVIIGCHVILTALTIRGMNLVWEPQVELPVFVFILTILFNTLISIYFITFGSTPHKASKIAEKSINIKETHH